MKIIDILNKIANGEEPPKKIVYENCIYEYVDREEDYWDKNNIGLFDEYVISNILNDEVTILETTITYKQDNIEKLKTHKEIDEPDYYANYLEVYDGGECEIDEATSFIVDKINEIIDKLNGE